MKQLSISPNNFIPSAAISYVFCCYLHVSSGITPDLSHTLLAEQSRFQRGRRPLAFFHRTSACCSSHPTRKVRYFASSSSAGGKLSYHVAAISFSALRALRSRANYALLRRPGTSLNSFRVCVFVLIKTKTEAHAVVAATVPITRANQTRTRLV